MDRLKLVVNAQVKDVTLFFNYEKFIKFLNRLNAHFLKV